VFTVSARLLAIFAAGLLLHSGRAVAQDNGRVLEFYKKIGVGWPNDLWQKHLYGWMSYVSFSPDGTVVASDGPATPEDVAGHLKLWSFPEGRLIKKLPAKVTAISPDWKYYTTSAGIGDMETGRLTITPGKNAYASYVFSRNGHYVAEARLRGGHALRILELPSGKLVSAFGKHRVSDVAISPDGQIVATSYWELVVLWRLPTGERLASLRGFKRWAGNLRFSPDGGLLAVGTDTGGIQVWDVHSRSRRFSLDVEGQVSDLEFSPDGKLVAAGTYGTGTVWLIDVSSGKLVDHQRVSDMGCGSIAFSPDGRFLITPSTGGLITWPYDQGGTVRVFSVKPR